MEHHPGSSPAPSPWVSRFAPLVPAGGPVLDLACGGGRHGRLFLARQHPVTFLDRDLSGLADLASQPDATLVQADLEDGSPWPLPGRRFAAVVVTNYLWRPLLPALIGAVAPGGLLLYETFMRGNERFGKPGNPDFLLAPDELFERCKDAFDIRAFEQGEDNTPSPAMRQRICAIKR
ncbi:class I SAM-dependent methyltransferase [uncultured Ferrovibrio sp.]|jgi:SAM-dependent methyltransferase|uniref:class I SAM-dependent methyltransferase n=1 Tax=uncultured Ferrovibrio sp. TaxID=1576913 RepID=UPI00260FDE82|nr:class I SAM-dependent methyltransferase [uncultured Ferrovibrio sp.]